MHKKVSEYLPISTGKEFLLKLTFKVCTSCVKSCLIYGSKRSNEGGAQSKVG